MMHTVLPLDQSAGQQLRMLRKNEKLSQLDLSMMTGISQRYLSCIETDKVIPSANTLHIILCALNAPIEQSNLIFLASGYAPRYKPVIQMQDQDMLTKALHHILHNQNPAPAFVLNRNWDIVEINESVDALLDFMELPELQANSTNLLDLVFETDHFTSQIINVNEVKSIIWHRASKEAISNLALAERLKKYHYSKDFKYLMPSMPSLVLIHIKAKQNDLKFFSTFTTFGIPNGITEDSLRIDHFIPANDQTWEIMKGLYIESI